MSFALRLDDVGKRYRKYEDSPLLINAALHWRNAQRRSEIWALRHLDLTVEPGECVGVIGKNGSGKSTMLQLLAGVSAPSEGRVTVRGRVAPMLAVGVGFNYELTGRENVYLNGTILGLSRSDIDAALDDIIDFAEIGTFIDTPVKFYSSGMAVRLGFAVAAQARPDVLLLDEVLAVGDIAFQMKCFDRMTQIIASGATVLIVSHNLSAIRRLCSRTLLLHEGTQRYLGNTEDALQEYQQALTETAPAGGSSSEDTGAPPTIPDVGRITDASAVIDGDEVAIAATIQMDRPWPAVALAIVISTSAGVPVFYESSPDLGALDAGAHQWTARLTRPLAGGDYVVTVALRSLEPLGNLDRGRPVDLTVPAARSVGGVIDLGGRLRIRT